MNCRISLMHQAFHTPSPPLINPRNVAYKGDDRGRDRWSNLPRVTQPEFKSSAVWLQSQDSWTNDYKWITLLGPLSVSLTSPRRNVSSVANCCQHHLPGQEVRGNLNPITENILWTGKWIEKKKKSSFLFLFRVCYAKWDCKLGNEEEMERLSLTLGSTPKAMILNFCALKSLGKLLKILMPENTDS